MAISVRGTPETIILMTSYSRSERDSCNGLSAVSSNLESSLSARSGLTYRPPSMIFFVALASSSGALSLLIYAAAPARRQRTAYCSSGWDAQHDHWQARVSALHVPQHVEAAAPRHIDIEHQHVSHGVGQVVQYPISVG